MKLFFVQKLIPGRAFKQSWINVVLPMQVKVLFNFKEKALVTAPASEIKGRGLSFHPAERKITRMNEPGPKP